MKVERNILIEKLKQAYNLKLSSKVLKIVGTFGRSFILSLKKKRGYFNAKIEKKDVNTFFGRRMKVMLPEIVSSNIYLFGFYDEKVCSFLVNCLKEGDVFIDIGAHIGFTSLLSSKLVGNNGVVHSFEPTPRTYGLLVENTKEYENIITHNFGVMDSKSNFEMVDFGWKYSAYNTFAEGRAEVLESNKKERIIVKTITLDGFVESKNVIPSLIKIDAENSEEKVLAGAMKVIRKYGPAIILEVGDSDINIGCSRKLIKRLLSEGYNAFECNNLEIVPHQLLEKYSDNNLLFIRE